MSERWMSGQRGQAHTIEAILATMLILSGLVFVMFTPAVTPLSSITEDKHLENQQRESVRNILSLTHENGGVKETILDWNTTTNSYRDVNDTNTYYTDPSVNTPLLNDLEAALDTKKVVYNVNVNYYNESTNGRVVETQRVLHVGSASNNAVVVKQPVTIHETDELTGRGESVLQATSEEFYMYNVNASTPVYNHAEVEVVAWRR